MIKISNLNKRYDAKIIYENFNMQIEKGKITVILGESGSGKTTLLNVLAGLTDYDGKVLGIEEKPSIVFQADRILKNLTVKENVKLVNPTLTDEQIIEGLKGLGIEEYVNAYPKSLSGGISRRVALLRGFAFKSSVMLMDEPLSSLDLAWKITIINDLKERQKKSKQTIVVVTHDIKEAVLLADRIIVLAGGKVIYDENAVNEKTEEKLFDILSKR